MLDPEFYNTDLKSKDVPPDAMMTGLLWKPKHFPLGSGACSTEKSSMYCNPDQKLIARKVMNPRIEPRIEPLINGFAFKSASKYLFIPIEMDCSLTFPQQLLFAVAISLLRDVYLVRVLRIETEDSAMVPLQ